MPIARTHRTGPMKLVVGLLACLALASCTTSDDDQERAFDPDPDCFGIEPVGLDSDTVECGMVEVPLHHDEPDSQAIGVAAAVLSGPDNAAADGSPVLVLGGGPGQVMVEPLLTQPQLRRAFDVGRDLIVIDQRGVGASDPALACPGLPALEAHDTAAADVEAMIGALGQCRDRLAGDDVDLDAFHHLANARDVDIVRQALGYDQLNLRGGSYGTQVALLAAQMSPGTTRSVTLSSPVDPRENWLEGTPAGFARALDRVSAICAADPACHGAVGDLDAAIASTVDRLANQPEEVTVQPPAGEEVTTTYTPSRFLTGLFVLFYQTELTNMLPAFVDHAADGDLEPLARLVATLEHQLEGMVATGMQMSMICSGEGALATPEAALADVDSPLVRQHWYPAALIGEPIGAACQRWDVEHTYDPADTTLDNDVPTLIVTGGLDHVTPPRLGHQLHTALPTSHLIEVAGAAHQPLETLSLPGPCGQQILDDFLADPTSQPDASCADPFDPQMRPQLPPQLQ